MPYSVRVSCRLVDADDEAAQTGDMVRGDAKGVIACVLLMWLVMCRFEVLMGEICLVGEGVEEVDELAEEGGSVEW